MAAPANGMPVPPEAALDPGLPIIDPHHHLRDRGGLRYLLAEYLEDLRSGHCVKATVAVETGVHYRQAGAVALQPVGETEFLAGIAAQCVAGVVALPHVAAGIVGYADLRLGEGVAPVLDAHIAAGDGRFRGV
ncbi:MAG: amidohydrolase, partial [Casimicrobiaceae bacterium]